MAENISLNNLPLNLEWPKWRDFEFKLLIEEENNKALLLILYKDEEKYRKEIDFNLCDNLPDVDVFSVTIAGFNIIVYLRYTYICVDTNNRTIQIKFQVWARSGRVKTKIGEYDETTNY